MGKKLPVRGDDGVAFDIDPFGFGFLTYAGKGRFVLFLLERSRHYGNTQICRRVG